MPGKKKYIRKTAFKAATPNKLVKRIFMRSAKHLLTRKELEQDKIGHFMYKQMYGGLKEALAKGFDMADTWKEVFGKK